MERYELIGTSGALLALMQLGIPGPANAQPLVGEYHFWIVRDSGASADTVAEGALVLFEEALDVTQLPPDLRRAAERESRWLVRLQNRSPNACFGFARSERSIDSREFYGGITEFGFTRWARTNGEVSLLVYRSPDAWQELRGMETSDGIEGRVHQRDWNLERAGPVEWLPFVAQRVAPPSIEACRAALELGRQSGRNRSNEVAMEHWDWVR